MRHLVRILFIFLLFIFIPYTVSAAVKGGINYTIPIDYTKLSVDELEPKANIYYNIVMSKESLKTNDEDLTSALNLYSMLEEKCPTNTIYPVKLGDLYERAGKDRYAKGNYYRAIGIDDSKPEAYFGLGEYYYKRMQYRRALKFYTKAYQKGFSADKTTLNRLHTIYKKLGDEENASKY